MLATVILGCMMASFFFSGMETGVLLLHRARIRHLKERGSVGAGILLDFMHHPGRLSSTVLVGHTVANSVAMVLVAQWFLRSGHPFAAIGAGALLMFILWFFGELLPKALFRRFPNRLTTRLAPILLAAFICLWPVVQLFNLLTRLVVATLGGRILSRQMYVTREELKLMAREGEQGVRLAGEQRNLVASILDSQNATARDIMRPRAEVITVKSSQSEEDRRAIAATSQFSRLPVEANGNLQPRWTGLWVVYDALFRAAHELRSPPRMDADTHLEEILTALRKARSPLGFVKDRNGNDIGIVTVEDVLHRYLGKINL